MVLIPDDEGLDTGAVCAEADSLGLAREADELDRLAERLRAATASGASPLEYADLLANDLEQAAISCARASPRRWWRSRRSGRRAC